MIWKCVAAALHVADNLFVVRDEKTASSPAQQARMSRPRLFAHPLRYQPALSSQIADVAGRRIIAASAARPPGLQLAEFVAN